MMGIAGLRRGRVIALWLITALATVTLVSAPSATAVGTDSEWSASARLVGPHIKYGTDFGNAVAVSSDGSTMVVGAQFQSAGTGAAYVYADVGGTWTRQAVLKASDAMQNDQFGWRVAIAGDGSTIAVGAPGRDDYTGVAYIFTRAAGSWTQAAELSTSTSVPNSSFGQSVAVSGSGSVVAVSATYQRAVGGAVLLYADHDGTWKRVARLTDPVADDNGEFGASMSMSADSSEVVVECQNGGPNQSGIGYAFAGHGGSWRPDGTIQADDADYDAYFGSDISISADGSTVALGAPQQQVDGILDLGAIYVFDHEDGGWTQRAELAPNRPFGMAWEDFGWSVAISAEGSLVVGGTTNNESRGRAWAYSRAGDTFHQSSVIAPGDSKSDPFGTSLGVSGDGSTVFLGADDAAGGWGAVYVMTH